jgi:heavy metal sensor kinase
MTRWRPRTVRMTLTLWYAAAMVVTLAVYAVSVFTFVSHNSSKALDDRLHGDIRWVVEMADQNPDGSLVWFEGDDPSGEEESPWLQVWSPRGALLLRSNAAQRMPIDESRLLAIKSNGQIESVTVGSSTYRILSTPTAIGGRNVVVQVAASEARLQREIRGLLLILLLGLPLGVVAACFGGYVLARRALLPVDHMAERARSITAARLGDRLPVDNPNDEIGRLATVFNDTLGTLESSFDRMRRFTADVSHELRTPLTAMRAVGEVALGPRRDQSDYRDVIGSMLEEVDRLTRLVDRLLALSRAEHDRATLSPERVDLEQLAHDVAMQLGVLAEEKGQSLTVERQGASTHCVADRLVLRQALINLVDNAIRYTPSAGQIRIRVAEATSAALVDVIDNGPGITEEYRARIFDRHYRAEPNSHGRARGTGLGLSIAKWAAEANGGRLTLESAANCGTTFRLTLPRQAALVSS